MLFLAKDDFCRIALEAVSTDLGSVIFDLFAEDAHISFNIDAKHGDVDEEGGIVSKVLN